MKFVNSAPEVAQQYCLTPSSTTPSMRLLNRRRPQPYQLPPSAEVAVPTRQAARGATGRGSSEAGGGSSISSEFAAALLVKGVPIATLEHNFPHVVERLASCWHSPELLATVLDELLLDGRGGRRGFPPSAMRELLAIKALCDGYRPDARRCPWTGIGG